MENVIKVTKTMVLELIKANLDNIAYTEDITREDVETYVDNSIAQIAHQAEKAKERAEAKREASDELRDKVFTLLGEDWKSGDEITSIINEEDDSITKSMVVNRLSVLCKTGTVKKEIRKVGDRKITCYARVSEVAVAE